jgi:hypothetical protein
MIWNISDEVPERNRAPLNFAEISPEGGGEVSMEPAARLQTGDAHHDPKL